MKKNIVKKIVAITFAAAMALTISPMAKAATTDQQASRIKIIYRGDEWAAPATPFVDEEMEIIVEMATDEFADSVAYTPLAVLAKRESEDGKDYRVFCRRTEKRPGAKSTYSIIEIKSRGDKIITDYLDADMEAYGMGNPAGWNETETPVISRHEGFIFNEAAGYIDGVNFTPISILATRETNETDFCFIAEMTTVSNNEFPTYALVYINENDEGLIKLSKVVDLLNA